MRKLETAPKLWAETLTLQKGVQFCQQFTHAQITKIVPIQNMDLVV